jgi:site-specific DNA-adenine methylase
LKNHYPTNLAIPKAAAAATRPIAVTFKAPFIGGCPVTLALKKPKTNKQMVVIIAETINPSFGVFVKK